MKYELNQKTINQLPNTGKRYDVRFSGQAANGLVLRIGVNGSKTWSFTKKIPGRNEIFASTLGKVDLDAHGKIMPSNIDEALTWAAQQRIAIREGGTKIRAKRKAQGPLLLNRLYQQYFEEHSKPMKRISSQQNDECIWRLHIEPEFGALEVKKITYSEFDAFICRKEMELQKNGGSGRRVNNILALMSSMMNFACRRRYIDSNPCFGIPKRTSDHNWPELTDMQRNALRVAAYNESEMMGLIVDMALITGTRKKEILNARWEEIRGELWTIPKERKKGKTEHVLTLPPNLHSALMKWRQRDAIIDNKGTRAPLIRNTGFVFPSNGAKYNGKFNKALGIFENVVPEASRPALGDIKGPWTKIRKIVGLPTFRFHDLRHDFGTQSAKAGVDVFALMTAMGHQRIETTMIYINKAGLDGQRTVLASREKLLTLAIPQSRRLLSTNIDE